VKRKEVAYQPIPPSGRGVLDVESILSIASSFKEENR
jgi:hypothetical protein